MGWCEGSYIADDVWKLVRSYIPERDRDPLAYKLYERFCAGDADCWEDHLQIVLDSPRIRAELSEYAPEQELEQEPEQDRVDG